MLGFVRNVITEPVLQTKRIYLVHPHLSHFEKWIGLRTKNQNFLKAFEPAWAHDHLSLSFYKKRLIRQKHEMANRRGQFFFIFDQTHHLLGGINLNNVQFGAAYHADLGYWLGEEFQGNGFMSETLQLIINHAFSKLELKRLNAACLPDNQRSINLLLKNGFEEEGYAKAYLQINGIWRDHRLFGLVNTN